MHDLCGWLDADRPQWRPGHLLLVGSRARLVRHGRVRSLRIQNAGLEFRSLLAGVDGATYGLLQRAVPLRPAGGMCEAQRADFIAASEGKITWQQYYSKWGQSYTLSI